MTQIRPGDVLAHIALVQAELEPIRHELGRPRDDRAAYLPTGAAPREVYAVARALFERADRLAAEHTGDHGALPTGVAVDVIEPAHVHAVVDAALRCVLRVKAQLGIEAAAAPAAAQPEAQPTDCLKALLLVNRQLDRLLARPCSPGEVDAQLAIAEGHALGLLAASGAAAPDAPALERGKRPGDVHARIITVLRALRPLFAGGTATMLEPSDSPIPVGDVIPSDCYDMAALLTGELAMLQAVHRAPPIVTAPGLQRSPRLPAHCYQRARRIELAVGALAQTRR